MVGYFEPCFVGAFLLLGSILLDESSDTTENDVSVKVTNSISRTLLSVKSISYTRELNFD